MAILLGRKVIVIETVIVMIIFLLSILRILNGIVIGVVSWFFIILMVTSLGRSQQSRAVLFISPAISLIE